MTSYIDPSVPIFGSPTTESVRHNFLIAKQEIEALQGAVGLTVPVPVTHGGTGADNPEDALENLGALPIAGGTMTGQLILWPSAPTDQLEAVSKAYVDAYFPVQIVNGGTGANNPTAALNNLGGAPIFSPEFQGIPTAPTPPLGDSSTIIATTEFVHNVLGNGGGTVAGVSSITVTSFLTGGGTGSVTIGVDVPIDIVDGGTGAMDSVTALANLGGAPIISPNFLGAPTAPTAIPASNDTSLATTEFVKGAISTAISGGMPGVMSVTAGRGLGGGGTGAVSLYLATPVTIADGGTGANAAAAALANLGGAPLVSPIFTGDPRAPTPPAGDSDTTLATTAFVHSVVAGATTGAFLPLAGGTMTGPLTLAGDPTVALQAATKQYVDVMLGVAGDITEVIAGTGLTGGGTVGAVTVALQVPVSIANGGTGTTTGTPGPYLPLAGGSMGGSLMLFGDPVAPLEAVTKRYVDSTPSGGATTGDTAPTTPVNGTFWWDSSDGQLYVWYDDGTSQQWVPATNVGGDGAGTGGSYLPLAGGTLTGNLLLSTGAAVPALRLANTASGVTTTDGFELSLGGQAWVWNYENSAISFGTNNVERMSLGADGNLSLTGTLGLTGNVTVTAPMWPALILKKADATSANQIIGYSGANLRWVIAMGTNSAGEDFAIDRYDNAGAWIGTSFSINRSNGSAFHTASPTGQVDLAPVVLATPGSSDCMLQFQGSRTIALGIKGVGGSQDILLYDYSGGGSRIQVNSGGGCTASSTWAVFSDPRVKRDIQPYQRGLAHILSLEPIVFGWNGKGGTQDDGKLHYGLAMQQIEEHLPELVREVDYTPRENATAGDEAMTLKSYSPTDLTFILINAVKELTARLAAVEARL